MIWGANRKLDRYIGHIDPGQSPVHFIIGEDDAAIATSTSLGV